DRLPAPAAVARALDDLPEPRAGLRRVQPVRIGRRALEVVDLPAAEVRPADVPPASGPVRGQDERALARADQCAYPAHPRLLSSGMGWLVGRTRPARPPSTRSWAAFQAGKAASSFRRPAGVRRS